MSGQAPNRIKELRENAGLSQAQLAAAMSAITGTSTLTRHEVSRWERGWRRPTAWLEPLADALGVTIDELTDTVPTPRSAGSLKEVPPQADSEDDVNRRALLSLIGAIGAGQAIPPGSLDHVLGGIEQVLDNGQGDYTVDRWDEVAWEYCHSLLTKRPGTFVADLAVDLTALGAALQRPQPPLVRLSLLRVSSQLTAYLAVELSDIGEPRESRHCWQTAIRAADDSGDTDLAMAVRSWCAARARWEGRPDQVVQRLLQDVFDRGGPPTVGLAQAAATRAAVLASLGDARAADGALRHLQGVYTALPALATTQPQPWGFGETDVWFTSAYVHAQLGNTARSTAAIDHSLALDPVEYVGRRANTELLRAMSLVREGHLNDGLDHATDIIQTTGATTTVRRTLTGQILQGLPADSRLLPAARDLKALTTAQSSR